MSHYIYRKKLFAETEDGYIVPFSYYSDSSITEGQGRNEYHPAWWCVLSLSQIYGPHLFVKKDVWQDAVREMYDHQVELLEEYNRKYSPESEVTKYSKNYYGNTYPGGSTLCCMRSFYSTRSAKPFCNFLHEHPRVSVTLTPYTRDYTDLESKKILLDSDNAVADAEKVYQELLVKYPEAKGITVSVNGL